MKWLSIALCIVAASVAYGSDCDSPPIETAEQATCLARADLKQTWPLTDWAALQPTVAQDAETWIVSFVDPSANAGALAILNTESGKVTQRLSYHTP